MDTELMEISIRQFLIAAGLNPTVGHLQKTPKRVTQTFVELLHKEDFHFTVFPNDSGYDQMILQHNITFTSLCAHHLLPFSGVAHVAYLPQAHYCGLSKLSRTVEYFARGLQVQETMTQDIAKFLVERLHPLGCAVIIEAVHMCMAIRGVKQANAPTITSHMSGAFMDNPSARQELLALIGRRSL